MKKPALLIASGLAIAASALIGAHIVRDAEHLPKETSSAALSLPQVQSHPPDSKAPAAFESASAEPALTLTALEQRLAESDPDAHDAVLKAALPAMVAKNPEEIARFAELQTDPLLRESLVRQVAQLWVNDDADSAIAWVRSLPDSPERVATLIDLSLAVSQTDPLRAISLRESDVGNIQPDGVLDSLVQQWAEKDFDAALAWTNARPRTRQRDKLLQRIAYVQAANGAPEAAARFVDGAFEDGPLKQEALTIVKDAARTP